MTPTLRSLSLALLMILSTTVSIGVSSLETAERVVQSTSARSLACSGEICLNEALPNPNGYDNGTWPDGEWVEIYNSGNSTVDVRDWYITNKASKTLYLNSTTIVDYDSADSNSWELSPDEYMVVSRNGLSNYMFYLANSNDNISLFTDSGTQVDQATWSSSSSGNSLEEDTANPTNDWVPTNTPSPGANNTNATVIGPDLYPSDLIINEVMANSWPSDDNEIWPGGEWVEVLNSGTTTIDLNGWSLEDAAGNSLEFDGNHLIGYSNDTALNTILPGETRILAVNGSGNSGVLNNGVETLSLIWPNGTKAQQVGWTDTEAGFSLVESSTSQYWEYAAYPSLNQSNPLPFSQIASTPSPIEFAEILSNSSSDGDAFPDGEWIELFNAGTSTVDLTGWSIIDGMGNVTFLDPGTLVFNQTQGSTNIDTEGRRLVQFSGDTELWDYYNQIMLRDNTGAVVDSAWYTTDYGQNISWVPAEIRSDPWVPTAWMTPGQPDMGDTPSTGVVVFTEIFPDAVGSDTQQWPLGEWVEIYNNGTTPLDVGGWKMQAAGRTLTLHQYNMPLQSTSIIQPGGVALIALNGTTSFYLKHTTPDSIVLKDLNGDVVDTASWITTVEGESLVAPNSTHAGAGPNGNGASTGTDWIQSAWATPGEVNPVWPEYTESDDLIVTEILASCSDDSVNPTEDWIEVMNNGSQDLNLSRWRIDTADNRVFFRTSSMWSQSNSSMVLAPLERAVLLMEDDVFSGQGDSFELSNPDGELIHTIAWSLSSECKTIGPVTGQNSWKILLWPTPGSEEPNESLLAEAQDIVFSRFMTQGSTTISSNTEFVEVSNIGDSLAYMTDWTLTLVNSANEDTVYTFGELSIPTNGSIILATDKGGISVYEDGLSVSFNSVLSPQGFTLPDSGAAIHIKTPTGMLADTIVYGNGPVDVAGWSGISLVEPVSSISLLVYHRGDGCGNLPDTDVALDWQHRWGRLGASTFCGPTLFSGMSNITPLVGPQEGLVDLLAWINGATESLHVHLYQIEQPNLVQALIEAYNRGVEVTVVLNSVEDWWNNYDKDNQNGVVNILTTAGVNTLWFGGVSDQPYTYVHSKVAVKDNQSVWIGSGNWKSSSHPGPDERGNSEWGVLVDNSDLAMKVLQQLEFDESLERSYITSATPSTPPSGWSLDNLKSLTNATSAQSISTDISGRLITCPDTCVDGLIWMIEQAEDEILLSLQYLDVDWSWGWGDNPLVSALEDAAKDGVRIRLILNGAYLNKDIQQVVDTFNEDWNSSLGYDVSAIVMSEDDEVSKLHNKGMIVDSEHVLISSINWGDSAPTRNREMGLIISSVEVTAPFLEGWNRDWIRTDNVTDSDNDGLPDYWEVANGLNRTTRTLPSFNILEGAHDSDGDGLTNSVEYDFGSHANNADTDGDCIPDALEVSWAQATALNATVADVSPTDALLLADADKDGVNESELLGCDLAGALPNQGDTTVDNGTLDDDADLVINRDDVCPNTPAKVPVNDDGCSTEQRNANAAPSADSGTDLGTGMMLLLMLGGLALAGGAFFILRNIETEGEEIKDLITLEEQNVEALEQAEIDSNDWQMPVLDSSTDSVSDSAISDEDLARCPGWPRETIQSYLDQGWSMDQLAEYYLEQVEENA